jgi:predicted ArsR family transcriptional regulator
MHEGRLPNNGVQVATRRVAMGSEMTTIPMPVSKNDTPTDGKTLPPLRFGLYRMDSKRNRESILVHPIRRAILEAISTHDGIRLNQIRGQLGFSGNAVRYHVLRLADEGLLKISRVGRYRRYSLTQAATLAMAGLALLSEPMVEGILRLTQRKQVTLGFLARSLGADDSALRACLGQMADAGLVGVGATGKAVHVRSTPEGRKALIVAKP